MLKGIHTIEDLKVRCFVNPETKCWEWRLSASARPRRLGGGVNLDPRVWLAGLRKTTTIGQAAYLLTKGDIPPGWIVWRTCGCAACGNPDHMAAGTRADFGRWTEKTGKFRGDPLRIAVNRRIADRLGLRSWTPEQIPLILDLSKPGTQVAAELGLSPSVVSKIRRKHRTDAAVMPTASVFAFARACR